jgi:hypothetical protein
MYRASEWPFKIDYQVGRLDLNALGVVYVEVFENLRRQFTVWLWGWRALVLDFSAA